MAGSYCSALLVSLISLSLGSAQLDSNGGYNCSRSYQLSPSTEEGLCCVHVSPALPTGRGGGCAPLMELLLLHSSTIAAGDCLELSFAPGQYMLPSLAQVLVQYSVVLRAPRGRVEVQCAAEGSCGEGERREGGGGRDQVVMAAMMLFNGTQRQDMFVTMDGITFSNCTRHLEFDELSSLTINNCRFIGFSSSALNLFNVRDISIANSDFRDCVSSGVSRQFRANAGALSIAYYSQTEKDDRLNHNVTIVNSVFFNNRASLIQAQTVSNSSDDASEINRALNVNFFNGRGGGVAIIVQEGNFDVHAVVINSTFEQNFAEALGGGLVLFYDGTGTTDTILVHNCTFLSNKAELNYGGGIMVTLLLQNLLSIPSRITVTGCTFQNNSAYFGGGFVVVQVYSQGRGNEVVLEDTEFLQNRAEVVGSAVMFQTFAYSQSRLHSFPYNITDCSFEENEASGGTFGAGFVNMNFFGTIRFVGNSGPALRLVGGLTVVNGYLSFLGNRVDGVGGALYVQEFAQVKLISGAEIEFINNTGRIGAAIAVDVQTASPVFSELVFNPQCFLIHEDATLPPTQWDDVSLRFSGNRASIGPVVFISHLLHCSWYSAARVNDTNEFRISFNVTEFPHWRAFQYDNTNEGFAHNDSFNDKFYFQTQSFNISSSSTGKSIFPGEDVRLGLKGTDQFENPTYSLARVSDARSDINLGAFSQAVGSSGTNDTDEDILRFEPALLPVQPDDVGMAEIKYGFTEEIDFAKHAGMMVPVLIDTPFNVIRSTPLEFNITLSTCLPGYEMRLENSIFSCRCTESNFYVLNCEEEVIVLRDGLWAGMEEEPLPHLDTTICPTPYCRCHTRGSELCEALYFQNQSRAGQQCHPTRNGTLCGRCVNDTGVGVLRTNCRDCENETYYALGFLVIGDLIIFGLIMFAVIKLEFHFPHSLKGLLFYIQTVYYTTEHFPIAFWDARKYMLYVSSALGLYFPYDFCLYPRMTALTSYGLKFIPPAIALLVCVITVTGAYCIKARYGRKRVWRGVWFIILLLYAPLLHNCVALLHCPQVPDAEGGDEETHWQYDGEVVCFRDPGHIVLGLLAIIVLTILALLIPTLFIFTNFADFRKTKIRYLTVERMLAALSEGYRETRDAIWWSSWELFRRLLLISIVVSKPGRSVASAYVVIISFAMHAFFMPYKKVFQNVIELVVLFNYTILLLVRSTQRFLDNATSLGYTGTAVPDNVGEGLPEYDTVIWVFIPFYYAPLIFVLFYSLTAILYRLIKSLHQRRRTKQADVAVEAHIDERVGSVYCYYPPHSVTRTEVDGPGGDNT